MKLRLKTEIRNLLVILAIGIAYYFWILLTDLRIPCVFNLLTGLLCPGCGVTRMIVSASKLDFVAAYAYNKFLFVTWPVLLIVFVCSEWNYLKKGLRDVTKFNGVLYIYALLFLAFGVIRNII